jgi:hypothetical protein
VVSTRLAVLDALSGRTRTKGEGLPFEGGSYRVYVRRRREGVYPTTEEFYVAAPALADDKAKKGFEDKWARAA